MPCPGPTSSKPSSSPATSSTPESSLARQSQDHTANNNTTPYHHSPYPNSVYSVYSVVKNSTPLRALQNPPPLPPAIPLLTIPLPKTNASFRSPILSTPHSPYPNSVYSVYSVVKNSTPLRALQNPPPLPPAIPLLTIPLPKTNASFRSPILSTPHSPYPNSVYSVYSVVKNSAPTPLRPFPCSPFLC